MDGNWHHIALTRQSGTGNLWGDGSLAASGDFSGTMVTAAGNPRIGNYTSGNEYPGYIDSIRLEVGYVRYTAPFTPPTEKFTV